MPFDSTDFPIETKPGVARKAAPQAVPVAAAVYPRAVPYNSAKAWVTGNLEMMRAFGGRMRVAFPTTLKASP